MIGAENDSSNILYWTLNIYDSQQTTMIIFFYQNNIPRRINVYSSILLHGCQHLKIEVNNMQPNLVFSSQIKDDECIVIKHNSQNNPTNISTH